MFTKTTALFAVFAIAAQVAVAAPPACLVAAVNTQTDPSALKAVCSGSNATQVEQYICKNCDDSADTAMSVFSSICGSAGVTIDNSTSCSSSSSSSASTSASATETASGTSSHGALTSSPSATSFVGSGGILTAGSSGIVTATSSHTSSGAASSGGAAATSTSGAASGASSTASPSTGMAARLGMDIIGMVALGAFGVMLAF